MSKIINKIKFWHKNQESEKISYENKSIRPKSDWSKILVATIVIVTIFASFSIYFYLKVDDGTYFKVENEESLVEVKINNSLLNKIVDDINTREKKLMEIKEGKDIPPNPSV